MSWNLRKKNKLILSWSIPVAALALGTAGSFLGIYISNSLDKSYSEVQNSKNISPISFQSFTQFQLEKLKFNPKEYDKNFFEWNIMNSPLVNSVFIFEGLTFDSENNYHVNSKTGLIYEIINMTKVEDLTNGSKYKVTILKKLNNVEQKYSIFTTLNNDSFADSMTSQKSFVGYSAEIIYDLFLDNDMKVISNLPEATGIGSFINPSDVTINTNPNSTVASSFVKNINNNKYVTNNSDFLYNSLDNNYASFEIPVSSRIWDSFYPTSDNDAIYLFLSTEYQNGNLNYLPELTNREKEIVQRLSKESTQIEKNDEISAETKARIRKLIFDPTRIPFDYDDKNNKIPLSTMQAVAIKVNVNNASSWIIVWTNLLSLSSSLVTSAPELEVKVNQKNNKELTYEELIKPENYKYVSTKENPSNNLIYEVKSISFSETDIAKREAIIVMKISHSDLLETKEYTVIVSEGFESKAYSDLIQNIKTLTSNFSDWSKINPTITKKENIKNEEIMIQLSNIPWLTEAFSFVKPTGINTEVIYKILRVFPIGNNKLIFTLLLSPQDDPENYIKYNNTVQELLVEYTLSTTLNEKNDLVFLSS